MTILPRPGVVLFVSDVPRMSEFYRELAAMNVLHADTDHAVLEVAGFELVIHAIRGEWAEASAGATEVREDAAMKLCLPVASIARARERVEALGGRIQPADREWQGRGFRACDGHDPEGNVLQVREPVA